jgi:nucleoside-diphosphate-sugar epimerase
MEYKSQLMALISSNQYHSTMTTPPLLLLLGYGYTLHAVAAMYKDQHGRSLAVARSAASLQSAVATGSCNADVFSITLGEKLSAALRSHSDIPLTAVIATPPPEGSSQVVADQTRQLARNLNALAIQRVVYLSTTGVFGREDGSWVNEQTPAAPNNPRSTARLISEETLKSTCTAPVTCLRLPAIYGPTRGIGNALKRGSFTLIDNGNYWTNRIQVQDLARAILAIVQDQQPPDLLAITDKTPSLAADVVAWYCKQFSLPLPPGISRTEARQRLHHTMLSNQRVDASLLHTTYPHVIQFPSYREGGASEFESLSGIQAIS